jgi:hypothetical protein
MRKHFIAAREDWDNLSDDMVLRAPNDTNNYHSKDYESYTDVEKEAYTSFEACGLACEHEPSCYQYLYYDNTCGLSKSFRLGRRMLPDSNGNKYTSGYNMKRINEFVANSPCSKPEWVHDS